MSQHERRRTPYPLTWEVPLVGLLVIGAVLSVGVHAGRAVALLLAGAGWCWPEPVQLFRSLPAVLTGDSSAGLACPVRSVPELMLFIASVEVLLLAALTVGAAWMLRRWGPQRLRGVASVAECESLLGRNRLWRARRIIRPDLYPTGRRFERSTE